MTMDPVLRAGADETRTITLAARPEGLRLDPAETAVVVIDMQNAYATRGGYVDLAGFDIAGAAGVIGRIGASPIGVFRYMKILKRRAPRPMLVSVYALEVTALLDDWQEIGQRVRHWMTPEEAAESVDEPDLAQVILAFSREV